MKYFSYVYLLLAIPLAGVSKSASVLKVVCEQGCEKIQYYAPIDGMFNQHQPTELQPSAKGLFLVEEALRVPTLLTLRIDGRLFRFLVAPRDRLEIRWDNKHQTLRVNGKNAAAHHYYNMVYFTPQSLPTNRLAKAFEQHFESEEGAMRKAVLQHIESETAWLDSLYRARKITKEYAEMVRKDITAYLSYEAVRLCDARKSKTEYFVDQREAAAIKEQLLGTFRPEDTVLYTSGPGISMFSTYYKYKGKESGGIDSTRFFIPDGGEFFMFMPPRLESYFIGSSLYRLIQAFPTLHDYCNLFSGFRALYPHSKWLEAIERDLMPCQESALVPDSSFLTGNNIESLSQLPALLGNRAVLVDLWATWCGPCIQEMRLYDADFYDYLSSSHIELVCVSIDQPSDEAKWKKMVGKMGLQGKHLLASPALVNSIKSAVYQGQPLTIPRYVLLGKNGVILGSDMPRPSEKNFKTAIEKALGGQ